MKGRRVFIKTAAAVVLAGFASPALSGQAVPQYAMIIDLERCMGCETCSIACHTGRDLPPGRWDTRVLSREVGRFPQVKQRFLPVLCNHCQDAPCAKICPEGAIRRLPSGIVTVNKDKCVACGECVSACRFDAIQLSSERGGKAGKCDFCLSRIEGGGVPLCVESCPSGARMFGDLRQPEGEFESYLQRHPLFTINAELLKKARVLYSELEVSKHE